MADLDARGDLQLRAEYQYDALTQIPGAAELIGELSGLLWRSPDQFEQANLADIAGLSFRWRSSAASAGIATVRSDGQLVSVSLLVCGQLPEQDVSTLRAFQTHLLRELHDTGIEPSFDLLSLEDRPLAATINFQPPADPIARALAALADRCFAAAYFRYQGLA
jgi:hypothetical protein